MASLTRVSIVARRIIRYGIYALILIIVARLAIRGGAGLYRRIFPPPVPEPTVVFGSLTTLPFPEEPRPENLTFTLELVEGQLPILPKQAEVYFMPEFQSTAQALDTAKQKASSMGFNPEGKIIIENVRNVYLFENPRVPSALTMNIITGVFSISYNINQDPAVLQGIPPSGEQAISRTRSFLQGARILENDLRESPATYEFLHLEAGQFVRAISQSEADVIKANIFRDNYGSQENIPAVTPDMPEANVWFLISGRANQIVASEYHYFPIDTSRVGTYPLKTAQAAWDELQSDGGFIANLGDGNSNGNIVIRQVYLGYYDAGQYTPYYQPVVVFQGDNDFFAYVPAVTDEYYGKAEVNSQ